MLIFFSYSRISGSSSTAFIFSVSVMKYGDRYPRSIRIPSTTSTVRLGAFGFLDRRRAFGADLLERVGHDLADARVVVSGDRRDLHALLVVGDRPRELFQARDDGMERAIEAALQIDRARAGGDIPHALGKDRRGQQRGGRRAIADHVAGAFGRLANHLRAEVLLVVLQLELLGDRHAVVADDRATPFLLDEHALRFRAQRHAHGIGQRHRAVQDFFARRGLDEQMLMSHLDPPFRFAIQRPDDCRILGGPRPG